MIEAFGGVGVNATTPDELKRAVNEAMDSGKPTLINAVIDPAAGTRAAASAISTRKAWFARNERASQATHGGGASSECVIERKQWQLARKRQKGEKPRASLKTPSKTWPRTAPEKSGKKAAPS